MYQLVYQENVITYVVTKKKIKSLNARIKADQIVYVTAPFFVTNEEIKAFLLANGDKIIKALKKIEIASANSLVLRSYKDGEKIFINGKIYYLKIIENNNNRIYVDENLLFIESKSQKEQVLSQMLHNYLISLVKEQSEDVINRCFDKFRFYQISFPKITWKFMTSRWGSCRKDVGKISLNIRLVQVPRECMEYVVVHEMAHLVEMNHSKAFYKVVEDILPNYKESIKLLKQYHLT